MTVSLISFSIANLSHPLIVHPLESISGHVLANKVRKDVGSPRGNRRSEETRVHKQQSIRSSFGRQQSSNIDSHPGAI
jgi:hypothetical protein